MPLMITVPDSIASSHNLNTRLSFDFKSEGKVFAKIIHCCSWSGYGIRNIIVKSEDSSFSGAQGATSRTDDKRNVL
ncbi:MAG: hypothetical protein WAM42_03395, partial [Candidatus Nitrosopolaris sp.]